MAWKPVSEKLFCFMATGVGLWLAYALLLLEKSYYATSLFTAGDQRSASRAGV